MSATAGIVDVNAWLGVWPFQYFRDDTARKLENRLEAEGIEQALVGNPEAAFNPDCAATNRLLTKRLSGRPRLRAIHAANPVLADWPDVVRSCRDQGGVAIRLFPGYHCYDLTGAPALELIEETARAGDLPLFIQMRMEDERTHHPRCRIPGVSVDHIVEISRRYPELRMAALCPYFHEAVEITRETTNVFVDIAYVETLRTVTSLLSQAPQERVLFGSHTPFLTPSAAAMKLGALDVPEAARRAIGSGNARTLLGRLS